MTSTTTWAGQATANPRVSVVMAVYNGERYLREAMDSILSQTYADFEFIIIDDSSTDDSPSILLSFADPRVCLVSNEHNLGLAKSLNRGIGLAKGEFIARQDADDVSNPGRLQAQVAYMEQNAGVGVIGTATEWIDAAGNPFKTWPAGATNAELQPLLLVTCPLVHGSVMFRRRCIDDVGNYGADMRTGQDYDLWLRVAEKWDIVNLPQVLYRYRWHDQMVSVTRQSEQRSHASASVARAIQRRQAYFRSRWGLAPAQTPGWVLGASRRWWAQRYVWWSQGARMVDRTLALRFLVFASLLDPTTPDLWAYVSGVAARKTRRPPR